MRWAFVVTGQSSLDAKKKLFVSLGFCVDESTDGLSGYRT